MPLVIVRVGKKLGKSWLARHERDGLDEWRLTAFVRSQYSLGAFEKAGPDVVVFRFRFQKRGGQVMRATLWVRERVQNGIVELVLYKGHVEQVENED